MFSAAQQAVLRHARTQRTTFIAAGAVRSGKTYAVGLSFLRWLVRQTEPHHHYLAAVSIEVAMRNLGFDLLTLGRKLGAVTAVSKVYGTCISVRRPSGPEQLVWVVGASDERARRRIQGSTMKGGVIEELTLLPRDFFHFAWTRLSVTGAKLWMSLNPEGPAHWAKLEVVDRLEAYDGVLQHFVMEDNPSLDAETIARYRTSLEGFRYQRLVEGQWAAASGAIWPDMHVVSEVPDSIARGHLCLTMDYALSGTLAVLAVRHDRPLTRGCVTHELYHRGDVEGLLTPNQLADRVHAWAQAEVGVSEQQQRTPLVLDPATPTEVKAALAGRGFAVQAGRNDVLPGISVVANRLREKLVVVHERCASLVQEVRGYQWDERAALYGEDQPVKAADHGCDALRYWVYTCFPVVQSGQGMELGRVRPQIRRQRVVSSLRR